MMTKASALYGISHRTVGVALLHLTRVKGLGDRLNGLSVLLGERYPTFGNFRSVTVQDSIFLYAQELTIPFFCAYIKFREADL
jgi:hypothetical protein